MTKSYQFRFEKNAQFEFESLDRQIQKRIINKMTFFERSKEPLAYAKKLKGTTHYFRFRIGDYRVIVTPLDEKTFIILLIIKIGHHREVYE